MDIKDKKNQFFKNLAHRAYKDGVQKIVAGGLVSNSKGEILIMTRKNDDFMGGIDELPSGNIESGEDICDGLLREINEETGMNVTQIQNYLNSFDYQSRSGKHVRQFNFAVITDTENVTLTEHDAYKWQNINQALNNPKITDEIKQSIEIYAFNNDVREQIKKKSNLTVGSNLETKTIEL